MQFISTQQRLLKIVIKELVCIEHINFLQTSVPGYSFLFHVLYYFSGTKVGILCYCAIVKIGIKSKLDVSFSNNNFGQLEAMIKRFVRILITLCSAISVLNKTQSNIESCFIIIFNLSKVVCITVYCINGVQTCLVHLSWKTPTSHKILDTLKVSKILWEVGVSHDKCTRQVWTSLIQLKHPAALNGIFLKMNCNTWLWWFIERVLTCHHLSLQC